MLCNICAKIKIISIINKFIRTTPRFNDVDVKITDTISPLFVLKFFRRVTAWFQGGGSHAEEFVQLNESGNVYKKLGS